MTCNLCKSSNVSLIKKFQPYEDMDWGFDIYDCQNCGVRFAVRDTSINYHEIIHSFEDGPYATHYNKINYLKSIWYDIKQVENFIRKSSPVFEQLLNYIKNKPKDINILEIGCSTGYVTAYLHELGYKKSLGIDISTSVVEFARREFGPFYDVKECEGCKYDVIFHSGLIGCVDTPREFLMHYMEKLNDKGIMLFNAPNVNSVRELNQLWVSTPPPDLTYLFHKNIFVDMFAQKDYKVSITETVSPLIILYKNRFNKPLYEYPRKFTHKQGSFKGETYIKKTIKKIVSFFLRGLIFCRILKYYSDDYGLIVKVEKK